jgi:hypothetical protein
MPSIRGPVRDRRWLPAAADRGRPGALVSRARQTDRDAVAPDRRVRRAGRQHRRAAPLATRMRSSGRRSTTPASTPRATGSSRSGPKANDDPLDIVDLWIGYEDEETGPRRSASARASVATSARIRPRSEWPCIRSATRAWSTSSRPRRCPSTRASSTSTQPRRPRARRVLRRRRARQNSPPVALVSAPAHARHLRVRRASAARPAIRSGSPPTASAGISAPTEPTPQASAEQRASR